MLRLVMSVLWPSFLVAILAEGFFFSLFDPNELSLFGGQIEVAPSAVYTAGFFFFWLFCSLASMLTYYLVTVPGESRPPF